MPCKASQHSYELRFLVRKFQVQAVLLYMELSWTAQAHYCCYVLSLAHYPSRTRLQQTEKFCLQGLWQCLSMPGKHWPMESLHSIVSACPRDLRHDECWWFGPEDISPWQLPVEGARGIDKWATSIPCQEGTLRGRRIWGHDPAYLGRRHWAKRPLFTCPEAQIGDYWTPRGRL